MCSIECNEKDFCDAWCIVESECMLTNFVISPQDGPDTEDTITCYTNRRPGNLMLRATASNSATSEGRNAVVLTRGIHNFHWAKSTAFVLADSLPYMLFEWNDQVLIKTIRIKLTQSSESMPSDQAEIRLGSSMPGGPTDFSQLELIGTFDNPQPSEWRTFTVDPTKKVKFLAILETDGTSLEIQFLEVFS